MWRVYYDDGEWDHTNGLTDMPIYGVLAVLQSFLYKTGGKTGYHLVHGCPYYILYNGTWLHCYENDMVDHITHDKKIDKLLVGRMVSKQVFGDVWEKAQAYKKTFV